MVPTCALIGSFSHPPRQFLSVDAIKPIGGDGVINLTRLMGFTHFSHFIQQHPYLSIEHKRASFSMGSQNTRPRLPDRSRAGNPFAISSLIGTAHVPGVPKMRGLRTPLRAAGSTESGKDVCQQEPVPLCIARRYLASLVMSIRQYWVVA